MYTRDTQISVHRTTPVPGGQQCARVGIKPHFKARLKVTTPSILERARRMVRTPFWVRTRQRRKALRRSGHGAVSVSFYSLFIFSKIKYEERKENEIGINLCSYFAL
ncbi:hypothetical protein ES332_A04G142300v1 [Gossypium tomentosum]|uniref:Uncharacterized protein n=1 Tax=Gossypium tomentosum TaxID=34277 RepID=A0A5D2QYP4_GOSTO|nr:hypothetical protein ES332_A04G142300v1 [Gossypium tomentosum]